MAKTVTESINDMERAVGALEGNYSRLLAEYARLGAVEDPAARDLEHQLVSIETNLETARGELVAAQQRQEQAIQREQVRRQAIEKERQRRDTLSRQAAAYDALAGALDQRAAHAELKKELERQERESAHQVRRALIEARSLAEGVIDLGPIDAYIETTRDPEPQRAKAAQFRQEAQRARSQIEGAA